MPALAAITINDGLATPVAHTFTPVTTDGYSSILAERTSIVIGNPRLETSVRPPVQNNGTYRVKFSIKTPKTVTVNGVSVVDHTPTVTLEFVVSERSAHQDRKDLRLYVVNLLQNAGVITMIEQLEPQY